MITSLKKINTTQTIRFLSLLVLFKILSIVFVGGYLFTNFKPNSLFSKIYFSFSNANPYEHSSFLLYFLASPWTYFAILISCLLYFKGAIRSWKDIENQNLVKVVVLIPVLVLAYECYFSSYNFFVDQSFDFERILILLLAIGSFFNPLFISPFIALVLLFQGQFVYPIPGYLLFDKRVLMDIILLFLSFLILKKNFSLKASLFFFTVLLIVISNYFYAGFSKLWSSPHGYEWIVGQMEYSLSHVVFKGWPLSESLINFVKNNALLLQTCTIIIELSSLLFFWKKKLSYYHICAFVILHFMIFYFSGCLFWKWIIVDVIALFILIKIDVFSRQYFYFSIIGILTCKIWLSPFPASWFPTKINQSFLYEVTLEDGSKEVYNKQFFAPFGNHFHHGKFHFIVNEKLLPIKTFGYTLDYQLSQKIDKSSLSEIVALEQQLGQNNYDSIKKENFENFLKTYFSNVNKSSTNWQPATKLVHLYVKQSDWTPEKKKIVAVKVYLIKTIIKENKSSVFYKKNILDLKID